MERTNDTALLHLCELIEQEGEKGNIELLGWGGKRGFQSYVAEDTRRKYKQACDMHNFKTRLLYSSAEYVVQRKGTEARFCANKPKGCDTLLLLGSYVIRVYFKEEMRISFEQNTRKAQMYRLQFETFWRRSKPFEEEEKELEKE